MVRQPRQARGLCVRRGLSPVQVPSLPENAGAAGTARRRSDCPTLAAGREALYSAQCERCLLFLSPFVCPEPTGRIFVVITLPEFPTQRISPSSSGRRRTLSGKRRFRPVIRLPLSSATGSG